MRKYNLQGYIMEIIDIPSTNQYINIDTLSIYQDSKGEIDVSKIVDVGNNNIMLEVNKVFVKKSKEWFRDLAILGIVMPAGFEQEINNIEFKDYKPFGISKDFHKMPVFKKPIIISIDNVDYSLLARYPKYAVSENGVVVNLNTKKVLSSTYSAVMQYYIIQLLDGYIFRKKVPGRYNRASLYIHKLVAMAWVHNDDYVNKNIIDHLDDDKLNNHKDNLNWASNGGNQAKITHGNYRNNILVRNVKTGEVKTYASLNDASYDMGRSRINHRHTPITHGRVWVGTNGKFEIKYANDPTPWKYDNEHEAVRHTIKVTTDTGEVLYFKSLPELKLHYGLPKRLHSAKDILTRLKKNGIDIDIEVVIGKKDKFREIEAKNIKTGTILKASTVRELVILINSKLSTVQKYLINSIDNKLINSTWLIRKATDEPWCDELGCLQTNGNRPTQIKVTTGDDVATYNSLRAVGRTFNLDAKTIKKLISEEKPYTHNNKKYYFTYI